MKLSAESLSFRIPRPRFSVAPGQRLSPPMVPDRPIYAVGDIHGRVDLLRKALRLIEEDALTHRMERFGLVFLGDYIDRGYASAQVLSTLFRLGRRNPNWVVCLRGNHEQLLLDFLENPGQIGPIWLRNGGRWTLESFGIRLSDASLIAADIEELSEALRAAIPRAMVEWLRQMPFAWQSGNIGFIHAGAAPDLPIEAQDPQVAIWGHPDFTKKARTDDLWVVHGHIVVPDVRIRDARVALDTGAYATGRLSVLAIEPDERPRILTT